MLCREEAWRSKDGESWRPGRSASGAADMFMDLAKVDFAFSSGIARRLAGRKSVMWLMPLAKVGSSSMKGRNTTTCSTLTSRRVLRHSNYHIMSLVGSSILFYDIRCLQIL